MESGKERYDRLDKEAKEVDRMYGDYIEAKSRAFANPADTVLQHDEEKKKGIWLDAVISISHK